METFWRRKGRETARRINLGRWLEPVVPATAGLCILTGCLLLIARRNGWEMQPLGAGAGVALLGIAWIGWRRVLGHRFTPEQGLVRLEAILGMKNRLSSAAAGVGAWPAPLPGVDDRLRWNWPRVLGPALAGAGFLVAACLIPVGRAEPGAAVRVEEPPAWAEVEKALEPLKEDEVADPEAIAAIERKLESLRAAPPEQWYGQSSLEAGDALRKETAQALAGLDQNLGNALAALEAQGAPGAPEGAGAAQWKEALEGLTGGKMPLQPGTLAGMPPSPSSLSQAQKAALAGELKKNAQACESGLASLGESLASFQNSLKPGQAGQGRQPGKGPGGPGPGGGHEALGIQSRPKALEANAPLSLSAKDREHLALGDAQGVSLGEHEPVTGAAPAAGGAVHSLGQGGEAVWKNELPPAEQTILREFFQ